MGIRSKIKQYVIDKAINWTLESKLSPIGWINGKKRIIGNALLLSSAGLVALQQSAGAIGVCPTLQPYCAYLDTSVIVIAALSSLLVKLVGEWHAQVKEVRVLKAERVNG
jgi:hypothetical protein